MAKKEVPLHKLDPFLPAGTLQPVLEYLHQFKIHLTITRKRRSILGDYRHRTDGENHRISINGNLNRFAFLVTLLHEIAHLLTFEKYGNRVQSHGVEWKRIYSKLLSQFLEQDVFPADIKQEIMATLQNPAASSCAEEGLTRVLHRYDENGDGLMMVEELELNDLFQTEDGRIFQRGAKQRKRFLCVEKDSGRAYLFSPVYRVKDLAGSRK